MPPFSPRPAWQSRARVTAGFRTAPPRCRARPRRVAVEAVAGLSDRVPGSSGRWCVMQHQVLVIAPHPDDEVLGCGGSIAKLTAAGAQVQVSYLTSGEQGSGEVPAG